MRVLLRKKNIKRILNKNIICGRVSLSAKSFIINMSLRTVVKHIQNIFVEPRPSPGRPIVDASRVLFIGLPTH